MKTIKQLILPLAIMFAGLSLSAQNMDPFELNSAWIEKLREMAPESTTVKPRKVSQVLVFTLSTGYQHWVIPHTSALMEVLGEKTGAFKMEQSADIQVFENLEGYDVVILNNNCSGDERRDLFWDELGKNKDLTNEQREKEAARLEENLLGFVRDGGGLMVVHGGIVMQNNSLNFSQMLGGSFDYHPVQQEVQVNLVEPGHPLLKAFGGKSFKHVDEPYIFNQAYFDYNFRPLLSMDGSKLHSKQQEIEDPVIYISWIKRYGKGRVFYVSPSHNAQSCEIPGMLQFYLDGFQYVAGDLKCDDTPLK